MRHSFDCLVVRLDKAILDLLPPLARASHNFTDLSFWYWLVIVIDHVALKSKKIMCLVVSAHLSVRQSALSQLSQSNSSVFTVFVCKQVAFLATWDEEVS